MMINVKTAQRLELLEKVYFYIRKKKHSNLFLTGADTGGGDRTFAPPDGFGGAQPPPPKISD